MAAIRNGRVTVGIVPDDLGAGNVASGSGRSHGVFSGYQLASSSMGRRRSSYRALGCPSPRSPSGARFFCEHRFEDESRHFLDACFLCKKPLGGHRDIFMYRGDTPFCSEECRQEQIDMDEAKEKNWSNLAMKASSRKEQKGNPQTIPVRATGAIVAG